MNFVLTFTVLISVYALLSGCSKDDEGTNLKSGSIKGHVTNAETNAALAGVAIITAPVTNNLIVTNNEGYYEILNINGATYGVTAQIAGYNTETKTAIIDGNAVTLDFSLTETPLSPGQGKIDFMFDNGTSWSFNSYNAGATCTHSGNSISLTSTYNASGSSLKVEIVIPDDAVTGAITLTEGGNYFIRYTKNQQGYVTVYESISGNITITSINTTAKTIKGTFETVVDEGSFTEEFTDGTFKGTWQ